jgi:hypothetical protein
VQGQYNFTRAGLRNVEQRGITPVEVWEVIESGQRLFTPVGGTQKVIYGRTAHGRYLAVLVEEDEFEDDVWDVLAARELSDREIRQLRGVHGGGDDGE